MGSVRDVSTPHLRRQIIVGVKPLLFYTVQVCNSGDNCGERATRDCVYLEGARVVSRRLGKNGELLQAGD